MLAMGFEPTSSLLKRQVRQPLRYASACKNHSASAPHGCRTRLITIKSRVHDRSANGAKFYDSAFVFVSSFYPLFFLYLIAAIGIERRDSFGIFSGFLRKPYRTHFVGLYIAPLRGLVR